MDVNDAHSEVTDVTKTLEFRCCKYTVSMAPLVEKHWPGKEIIFPHIPYQFIAKSKVHLINFSPQALFRRSFA